MLRFLAGILLVQAASVALLLVAEPAGSGWSGWPPLLLALGVIGLVAAFWFAALAAQLRRDEMERLRADFARQREDLRIKAERDKTQLLRKSQKTIASETRRAETRANLKVATAVAAAAGVGLLMILTNFMTLGLLVMSGAGGALGGYLLRRNWLPNLRRPAKRDHSTATQGSLSERR